MPPRFLEHIESGGNRKGIKIPKLSEEEYIKAYFTRFERVATSCKWPESKWVAKMFNKKGFESLQVIFQQEK